MKLSDSNSLWKPKSSVRLRFALAQGFFIAAVISALALALYFPVRDRLVSITDGSYRLLADNLASGIYPSFISGNREGVLTAVSRVKGLKGVKYVMVIDANKKVYLDTLSGPESLTGKTYTDDLTPSNITGEVLRGKVVRGDATYYNYVAPFISQNQPIYSVRLGIEEDVIDGEFNRLARLFISLGTLGVLVGIIAAYILASRLTKPIIKLTESALAIRAGNLNAYPDITTNDELEQLSREFQNMVEKLKQYYFQEYSQKNQALTAKKRLEEINDQLRELDIQKTDFMNAASHQLRTPLSIIHWSLSMIVDEAANLSLPDSQRELLEESLKSTKRMVDLVNDLLDISRIEQGRKELTFDKGNYGSICGQLVQDLKVLAQNKNLELSYEQIGEVPDSFLDEKAFYQIVNNFVDNAIKYTENGFVRIACRQKEKEIEITIADSGIGMDTEEQSRLFTRFMRGDQASKMFANGSGLGMYVAQSLLKKHGGSISMVSEKGKGTTFTLTAPLYDKKPETASS
ncbi:MAG: hypothetical protein K0S20_49 [Patescibacteria group bacterium]|nr:hypothetical protein [Patescibacteria group bacterium]